MKKSIYKFGLIILCIILVIMSNINVYAMQKTNIIKNTIDDENSITETEEELRDLILNTNNEINENNTSNEDNSNIKTIKLSSDGVYTLAVGRDSSKVLEVAGSSTENGAKVDIWNNGDVPAQKFNIEYKEGYYKITARHSGKSLTVKNGKIAEETEIVQEEYKGLDTQKWIIRDSKINGLVISLLSNPEFSITVKGNIENGAKIILSKTENSDNQMLYFFNKNEKEKTVKNGVYSLALGADSNKVLEIAGSSTENGAKVDIWNNGNVPAQKFNIEYKEGYYKITARHSGKSLTVKDGILQEESQIIQEEYKELDTQKWIIRDSKINGLVISLLSNPELSITVNGNIENGAKIILSRTQNNNNQMLYFFNKNEEERTVQNSVYSLAVGADSNKVIEVVGSSKEDNAKIDIWNNGNVPAQKFNVEYKEGYYEITASHTGKSLTVKDEKIQEGTEIVQSTYKGLDTQKWIIQDSKINGLVVSSLANPELSITVDGNIENGSKIILSRTQNSDKQMFYFFDVLNKNIKEGLYGKSGLMYKGEKGNYLKYYQIGNGKKHLFATFSVHGFEDSYNKDGAELTYIADEFFKYLKNNMSAELINEWTIYILPVVNPDGQYDGWTHNGPGRTTIYSWAPEHKGIDINRCFPVGYTKTSSDRNYNGTEPLQAYEAQSLRDFILANKGNTNIVLDVHGWLNETIGDNEIGKYYRDEIGISKHIGTYGNGYLIQWARTIPNTKSLLLELPQVKSHEELVNKKLDQKFINATMKLLEDY